MPPIVCTNAKLQCSFGGSITLLGSPENRVKTSNLPAAVIFDNVLGKNLAPAGMCTSLANPAVAAATAAAAGVLTPQPCVPVTPAPWSPGCIRVMFNHKPALNNTCILTCIWGGVITVTSPGQTRAQGL